MSEWFVKEKYHADHLVSSSAIRAMSTALIFAGSMKYPAANIEMNASIYEADVKALKNVIEETDDKFESLMLFGHNPGITALAYDYTKNPTLLNIPTCGIYAIDFPITTWSDLALSEPKELFYHYPKNQN